MLTGSQHLDFPGPRVNRENVCVYWTIIIKKCQQKMFDKIIFICDHYHSYKNRQIRTHTFTSFDFFLEKEILVVRWKNQCKKRSPVCMRLKARKKIRHQREMKWRGAVRWHNLAITFMRSLLFQHLSKGNKNIEIWNYLIFSMKLLQGWNWNLRDPRHNDLGLHGKWYEYHWNVWASLEPTILMSVATLTGLANSRYLYHSFQWSWLELT